MKKFSAILAAFVLVFSVASVSFGAIPVKYSVIFPATGTQADGAKLLGQIIEKVSEGRLVMEFYPSAQLGDKASTFEGLSMGTIEMTECAATDLSAFNDMWSVFSLPYLWDNGSQAIKTVMKDSVRKILEADAEENGFMIIAWTDMGSRSVLNTKRSVKTPADLNGLKLRCMEDPVLANSVNAMGAIGTPLAFSELYIALQQGTVDGLDHTPSARYGLTDCRKRSRKENGVEILEVDKKLFSAKTQSVVDDFLKNASKGQKALYEALIAARESK